MKYNGWKELTRTSVVTLSLLHPFDSRTCQCRSVYLKCSSPRESGRRDCQDMCNIVKQQNNSCSVLRDADAYFGIWWVMWCWSCFHVVPYFPLSVSFCITKYQERDKLGPEGQKVWHWYQFSQQFFGFVVWAWQRMSLFSCPACGLAEQTFWLQKPQRNEDLGSSLSGLSSALRWSWPMRTSGTCG